MMGHTLVPENSKRGARNVCTTPQKVGIDSGLEFVGRHFFECADETKSRRYGLPKSIPRQTLPWLRHAFSASAGDVTSS